MPQNSDATISLFTNLVGNENNEQTGLIYRLRSENMFSNNPSPYTQNCLVRRILESITHERKTLATVGVFFTIEFAAELWKQGYANVTVMTDHFCHKTKRVTELLGYKYMLISEVEKLNMKFDVIVGNPPYQRDNNDAKRWTKWEEFVEKSFQLGEIVALITPQSITGPNGFKHLKGRTKILNVDVKKYFTNVNSTFCYYICYTNEYNGKTKIISENGEFKKNLDEYDFLPFSITEETLKLNDWLSARKSRKWVRGELHTSNKTLFNNAGQYEVFHTNAQSFKTDIEHENKSKIRVCVSLSGYPKFSVIQNSYCSQATMWTEFDNIDDAEKFAEECNGSKVQQILKIFKWSGWNSKNVIEKL